MNFRKKKHARIFNENVAAHSSLRITKHHAMKTYWGSGGITPRILELGTKWR
jgi:hypothetical protein